jgi:hypothetical protein
MVAVDEVQSRGLFDRRWVVNLSALDHDRDGADVANVLCAVALHG